MSGYIGSAADAAQELAHDHINNLIWAARRELARSSDVGRIFCEWCGDPIPPARTAAMKGCVRCVTRQEQHDRLPKTQIRMPDRIL